MAINNAELINAVERLKVQKIIRRDSELAERLDYSKGIISEYLNNRKQVSDFFMAVFYEVFPDAKNNEQSSQKDNSNNAVIVDMGGTVVMNVPLVNKYAYGGYLSGYGDAEYIDALPRFPFMVDKAGKGSYIAIEVKGESMDDGTRAGYIEGDILLCREVPQHHWQNKLHIKKWDFVIVTKTDGILIKKISQHNPATGDITLHSLNDEYEDLYMNLNEVAKIFNVIQVSFKK